MSRSVDQFNLTVICQYHNKKCNLLCCYKGCSERALCTDCFPLHDYAHLSSIVPLDLKTHFTPNLFTKQILDIESDVVAIQDKIKKQEDEFFIELDKFLNEIQDSFIKKIATFRIKIIKFVEEFNVYYNKNIMAFLNILKTEYNEIDKIIKMDKEYFSSDRVQKLLMKQHALEKDIIPALRKQASLVIRETQNRFIKLQKNDIFLLIDEKFNDLFRIESFLYYDKHIQKPIIENLSQTNIIQQFFKNSQRNENVLSQSANAFTFSDKFPLPNFQEFNFSPPNKKNFIYGKTIPRHFEIYSHKDIIKSLVNLKDSNSFASASGDNIVMIWNLMTGKSIGEMQVYHKELHAICYISELYIMITSGKDLNIRIWDIISYKCKKIIKEAHEKTIYSLLYLKDGTHFVSGSADKLIKMWNINSGQMVNIFEGHENSVKCLFFLNGLYCFCSGGSDSLIKIWDITQNKCKSTLKGHEGSIYCFEFLQSANLLFSGGKENKIKICEVFEEGYLKTLEGHKDGVFCLKLINNDNNLISGGGDFLIKIWDLKNDDCILVLKGHQEIVSSIIVMKNDIIISGGWDHKVFLWKL